jgi:hypothetical protein
MSSFPVRVLHESSRKTSPRLRPSGRWNFCIDPVTSRDNVAKPTERPCWQQAADR